MSFIITKLFFFFAAFQGGLLKSSYATQIFFPISPNRSLRKFLGTKPEEKFIDPSISGIHMEKKFYRCVAVGSGLLLILLLVHLFLMDEKELSLSELYSKAYQVDPAQANTCAEVGYVYGLDEASSNCLKGILS